MTPQEEAEAMVRTMLAVKGNEPTDEEIAAIARAVALPLLRGIAALEQIARVLTTSQERNKL